MYSFFIGALLCSLNPNKIVLTCHVASLWIRDCINWIFFTKSEGCLFWQFKTLRASYCNVSNLHLTLPITMWRPPVEDPPCYLGAGYTISTWKIWANVHNITGTFLILSKKQLVTGQFLSSVTDITYVLLSLGIYYIMCWYDIECLTSCKLVAKGWRALSSSSSIFFSSACNWFLPRDLIFTHYTFLQSLQRWQPASFTLSCSFRFLNILWRIQFYTLYHLLVMKIQFELSKVTFSE